jgi:hypothetical protein
LAAVIELQIQADIKQAAAGLQTMLTQLTKLGTGSESQAKVVQSSITKLITASKSLQGLDFGTHFEQETKKISDSAEAMQAKAAGMEKLFESFGTNVNLSGLVAAFQNTDKSVEALEAQMVSLQQAIALTADPIILQRFGDQLNKLQSQLAAVKVVGAVKVEKIDIPRIDVPLVAPKIDVSQLKALQASFNDTIDPVTQLENRLKGLQDAVGKSTNPVLVASFRAEIEKLKTQLTGLKFDKIDVDPTSLRVLQSAFIDANKPLEQLQREISVVDDVLKQATANGSKDVGRLRDVLVTLNTQFAKVNASSLETAFDASIKSAQQLKNEIFALGAKINIEANPEDIIRFSDQIKILQGQLNNLKFGGIDLQIDTTSLSRLQSAFIDAIKPAQQLEQEIEALEQALNITADPSALKVYGAQIVKLKGQLNSVNVTSFETAIAKAGKAAQVASNRYKPFVKGSNEALRATVDLGRVLQDAPFGFIGIANNINPLVESFQRLGKESGSLKGALRALGGSLIGAGGLGLALSAFQFIALGGGDAIKKMFSGADDAKRKADSLKEAANAAKEAAENFILSLNDVAQANIRGAQQAQDELLNVELLYKATQNQNLAYVERKKAVDALQNQYPKYFKNLSDEAILAGGAAQAYDKLRDSLIAVARAEASKAKIQEIAAENLVFEEQRAKVLEQQLRAALKLTKATKDLNKASDQGIVAAGGVGGFGGGTVSQKSSRQVDLDVAQGVFNSKLKETDEITQKINKNVERQKRLYENIAGLIDVNGVDTIIGAAGKAIEESTDRTKFNFFDRFFDLTPPENQIEQQVKEMADVAKSFAQKNIDLFKVKVGDKFIDLSELDKVSDRREVVELGKKVWESIQNGLVQFKPPKIDLATEINLVPSDNSLTAEQAEILINKFTRSIEDLQGKANVDVKINIDDVKKADEAIKSLQQKVKDFSKNAGINSEFSFGEAVDKEIQKIMQKQLDAFISKNMKANMSEKELEEFEQRLAGLSGALANSFAFLGQILGGLQQGFAAFFETVITGSGNAFQKLGQAVSQMLTKLVASLAAMAAISGILSLIFPGAGGFSKIFSGLIGSSFGIKPFAAGGLVYGPTLGLVGEGSGTSRSNPEVIAPLDKLKNYISGASNGGFANGQLVSVVRGKDIALVYERFNGYSKGNA